MAHLIKCSACSREVSDEATSCPHCGQPIKSSEDVIHTIQKTKKQWKRTKLIGTLLLMLGFFILSNGMSTGNEAQLGFGIFVLFIGLIFLLIGRIGAWWTTG